MSNFTTIAPKYQQTATLQKSASERLFEMLQISRTDDVLDLGCGTGHLTQTIRSKTDGIVVGTDPTDEMIAEATHHYGSYRQLRKRGVSVREAWNTSKSAHGPWRQSKTPALTIGLLQEPGSAEPCGPVRMQFIEPPDT